MKNLTVLFLLLISFQSFSQESEDIQYVTGKLYLSLYQQADSGSQVIKSLVSGDRLNVIEIAGPYAKVITTKDQQGWVKKGFIVKSKPASVLYKEVNSAYKNLQQEMERNKQENSASIDLKEVIQRLEKENKKLKVSNELYLSRQTLLNKENNVEELEDSHVIDLETFKQIINEYFMFLLASLILLILIGFRVGELKTESDVIKHFGGVRVW